MTPEQMRAFLIKVTEDHEDKRAREIPANSWQTVVNALDPKSNSLDSLLESTKGLTNQAAAEGDRSESVINQASQGQAASRFAHPGLYAAHVGVPNPASSRFAHSDIASQGHHEPDILEQNRGSFGKLAVDPDQIRNVLSGAFEGVTSPVTAAGELMKQGPTHPGDIDSKFVSNALKAGPMAMLPGFARAAGGVVKGALGVSGAELLSQPYVGKLIRQWQKEGKSARQIADDLNTRYASELDAGASVKGRAVDKFKDPNYERTKGYSSEDLSINQRGGRGGRDESSGFQSGLLKKDTELGVMGGYNPSNSNLVTPELVENWMKEAGIPITQNKVASGGTSYLKGYPPGNPPRPGENLTTVRIPTDEGLHRGRPPRASEAGGNYFDTGAQWSKGFKDRSPYGVQNASGEPYSNPQNLFDALRWRFSADPEGKFLVPPGKEPMGGPVRKTAAPQMPIPPDPNQMQLALSGFDPRQHLQPTTEMINDILARNY